MTIGSTQIWDIKSLQMEAVGVENHTFQSSQPGGVHGPQSRLKPCQVVYNPIDRSEVFLTNGSQSMIK
ncbi:hypothetical protein KAI11_00740 [Candidatus Bathyarchaeota archaeon]|nr:hypothetical protein [Candidatus Bathyarchaeota archaeon]